MVADLVEINKLLGNETSVCAANMDKIILNVRIVILVLDRFLGMGFSNYHHHHASAQ